MYKIDAKKFSKQKFKNYDTIVDEFVDILRVKLWKNEKKNQTNFYNANADDTGDQWKTVRRERWLRQF